MLTYWNAGERLVDQELALDLAAHLIQNKHGYAELERQLPMKVSQSNDRWVVSGSKTIVDRPSGDIYPISGKVIIVISMRDCKVLSFVQEASFAVE